MNVEEKIDQARVSILLDFPFFSFLLTYLKNKEDKEIPAAYGTDGKFLYYNPKLADKYTLGETIAVLLHEILHPALGTFWRQGFRENTAWNIATDFTINLIVEETITKLNSSPSGLRRSDIKLPTNICLDHKYKNWSSEQVYEDLTKKSQGQNKKGDKGQRGESGEKVVGKTAWDEFCAGSSFGKNTGPGEAKSAAESEALKEEWKDRITRAADIAKKQGKLPGGFESLIDDLLQPKLPWKNLLSRFIQSTIYDDYRIMPPHRNHVYRGIYLPSEFGEALEIAVALDTSGSISDEELTIFISEVLGICKITNNFKIHYYAADARVAEKRIIGTYDTIPNKFPGRGGTDFRPVFDDIEENNINPSVLVYFTDGEGPFPRSAPNYPVIWLMTTDVQPPFGTIIKYDKYI